jgi:hypothetical protein
MLGVTLKVKVTVAAVRESLGISLAACCRLWLRHPIHFILITGQLHTYIMRLSIFHCGWWSWGHNLSLICAWAWCHVAAVGDSLGLSLAACCRLWLRLPTHFILISGLIHNKIMRYSIFHWGWWSWGHNLNLICAWSHIRVAEVGVSLGISLVACCRLWLRLPTHFISQQVNFIDI